jgi:hypothetical protein
MVWMLLAATGLISASGCGTAAYEKEHAKTLEHLKKETPFTPLWEKPIDNFQAKGLSLRIPKVFRQRDDQPVKAEVGPDGSLLIPIGVVQAEVGPDGSLQIPSGATLSRAFQAGEAYALNPLTMLTPDPRRPDDVVDPYRVLPDYLRSREMAKTLYGHQRTYEGFTDVTSQQSLDKVTRPYYLYVFFMPKEQGKLISARELERDLRDKLIKKFGKKDVSEWETVEPAPPTPAGGTMTWRRLKASGEQYWAHYEEKVARYKIYSGDLILYLHSTPDYHVLLGWRCAPNVAEAILLKQIAPICAGSVKVE